MEIVYLLYHVAISFGLYAIVALSLNLEFGHAGIPNFGRALAVLTGAFAVGAIVNRILIAIFGVEGGIIEASGAVETIANELIGQNPALGIALLAASLGLAGALGALIGALSLIPCAKLKAHYLAITLLAISEVARLTLHYSVGIVGGYYGVSVPNIFAWVPAMYVSLAFSVLILAVATAIYLLVRAMTNSPYGRLLKAVREDEEVVKAYGVNTSRLKVKTMAIGSAMAAIAGALYSLYAVSVIAGGFTRVEWTFYPFLMVLAGGYGNNKGVLAGVFAFVTGKTILTVYKHEVRWLLRLPFETVWLEYMLFGVLMMLILLYRPAGLIKEEPIMTPPIRRRLGKA